jgi:hypothetical protein
VEVQRGHAGRRQYSRRHLLDEYKQTLSQPTDEQQSRTHDDAQYARIQNLRVRQPSSYARTIAQTVPRSGSLRLITAGRRDGEALGRYAETVRKFDWQDFYDRWAGGAYIDFFRKDLVGEDSHFAMHHR